MVYNSRMELHIDRAGKKAVPLTNDEWTIIFRGVVDGWITDRLKKELSGRDRVTVIRAYNVASALYRRNIDTLSREEAETIAEEVGYNATTHFVERVFNQYLKYMGLDHRKTHEEELSEVAKTISEWLRKISRYLPPSDEMIGTLAVNADERGLLDLLDSPSAQYLLSHIKYELPAMENLKTWLDLKVKDITLELIRIMATGARRGFKGTCDICRGATNSS